jgi:methylphosphotriester-DNA--protein-cysteine methyltransferase
MTLYEGGTLDLQTAASQAGISPDRLRRAVRRTGGSTPSVTARSDRVPVGAD